VDDIRSTRNRSTNINSSLDSIEGLGDSWKGETAAMIRKFTSYARDLDHLEQPPSASSIASIVDACKALLQGTLEELLLMQSIEVEVASSEKKWVEDRLQAIANNPGCDVVDMHSETAAWRM
jgi:hypothetical protein